MTAHPAIRRLAAEQSPLGVDAEKVLEDLAAARVEVARLTDLLREYRDTVTTGGPRTKPQAVVDVDPRVGAS